MHGLGLVACSQCSGQWHIYYLQQRAVSFIAVLASSAMAMTHLKRTRNTQVPQHATLLHYIDDSMFVIPGYQKVASVPKAIVSSYALEGGS